MPPTTFLLQVMQTLEDDTFPMGETVSDVGEIVTKIQVRVSLSPSRTVPQESLHKT
jgi:hypothetical protein